MKITGIIRNVNGDVISHVDIDIPDVFLTRRDQLALAAPGPPEYTERDHGMVEKQKAKNDDKYIMKAFSIMEWQYHWADKMIAASKVTS